MFCMFCSVSDKCFSKLIGVSERHTARISVGITTFCYLHQRLGLENKVKMYADDSKVIAEVGEEEQDSKLQRDIRKIKVTNGLCV